MYNKKVLTEATRNLNKVKVRVKKRPSAQKDNVIQSRTELDAFVYPTIDNASLMKEGGSKQFVNSKEHGVDAPTYFQVHTAKSPIHGTGVFTKEGVPAGSSVGVTHIRKSFDQDGTKYRAPFPAKVLGGYNHSETPNVTEVDNGDHIVMVSLRDIEPGEELVSNYNDNTIEDLEKPEDFKNELTKASKGVGKVIQAATKTKVPKQLTLPLEFTPSVSNISRGISPEQIAMIQSKFNVVPQIDPSRYSTTEFLDDVNFQLGQGLGIKRLPNLNLKLELDRPIGFYPKERFIDNEDYAFNLLSDFHTPGKFEKMGEIDLGKYKGDKEGKTFEKIYDFPFKDFSGPIPPELKGQGISGEANKAITNSLQRFGLNPLISSDRHTTSGLERWKRLVELGLAEPFSNMKNENRFQLLNWALPIIGTGAGAYGLTNPWQQEQPNYLINRRDGGATSPEQWEQEIRAIEKQIGNPSGWTMEDYYLLQDKLNTYKNWRENTPEGQAVVDYHNEEGEYDVQLPEHLQNKTWDEPVGEPPVNYAGPVNYDYLLDEVYSKYPGLQIMNDQLGIIGDPSFNREATGVGDIEFFGPNEDVITYPSGFAYAHPNPGGYGIPFNPQTNDAQSIALDMLHGMDEADPEYKKLKKEFGDAYFNSKFGEDFENEVEWLIEDIGEDKFNEWYGGDAQKYFDHSYIDGVIRNLLFEGTPEEFEKHRYWDKAQEVYLSDPKLKKAFNKLKKHLTKVKSTPDKYVQAELSQEEIDEYVKGGYIVEELPKARYGLSVPKAVSTLSKTTKFKPITNASQLSKLAPAINTATINASVVPFKSEINWADWNPDTPLFEDLIREYNIIEQSSKAGGNWLKNPDMSKFLGSPEQFVQFQSSHFNKAFPSGYETLYRGMRQNTGDLRYNKNKDRLGSSVFATRDKDLAGYYLFNPQLTDKILTRADHPGASGIYELARPKSSGITLNAGYSDWDAFDLLTPTEMRPDILDRFGALQGDISREGGFGLMDPFSRSIQKQRNELLTGQYSADEVVEKMRRELGDEVSTDMLAAYAEAHGVPYIEVKNVIDGKFGDVVIVNQSPGNYLKSLYGNVGFFDQTNPNVYKSEGGSLPKANLGLIVRKGLYKGINPASYNITSKIKSFPKEFHLNTVSNATRPFRVGEGLSLTGVPERADQWLQQRRGMTFGEYNILPIEEKMKLFSTKRLADFEDIGKRRLDAWATGLGLPQEYNTLEQVGDNTYHMLDTRFDPMHMMKLHNDLKAKYHMDNPPDPKYVSAMEDINWEHPLELLTKDYRKVLRLNDPRNYSPESMKEVFEEIYDPKRRVNPWVPERHAKPIDSSTGSIWDADQYGVMGGYRWDISKDPRGLLFTQRDLWDLKPFEKRGETHLAPSQWRIKALQMQPKARKSLENLEMLGLVGGKPFNIENNFLVDPETYQIIDKWEDGGELPKAYKGLITPVTKALSKTYKLNPLAVRNIPNAGLKWSPTSQYSFLQRYPDVAGIAENPVAGFDPIDMSTELIEPHWLKGYPKLSKKLDVTEWNDIASKVQDSTYPVGNLTDIERDKLFDVLSKTRNKELLAALSTYPVEQGVFKSDYIPKKEVGSIKPHQMFSPEQLEVIGTYRRDLINSHLYGGYDRGFGNKLATNATLGLALPALGVIGLGAGEIFLDDPYKNAINRKIGYPVFKTKRGDDPSITYEDKTINLNDNELTYGQMQDAPEGRILIGGDFVGTAENTVRTAEEWAKASDDDTYGDDDFKTKDVVNYYGVEDGKFKVGKAGDFKKDTKIVPNRYDKGKTLKEAKVNESDGLRLFDNSGKPIYHNSQYGGKIILYSKDSGNAVFISHKADDKAVNQINDFVKDNKNVIPVVIDNGRFMDYMVNKEGLTKENYDNYYSNDFHRGENSGYNIVIKKDGGELPKARLGLTVPKIKLPKVKPPKPKPNVTGISAELLDPAITESISKMTNTGLLDDFMITSQSGFKPSRDFSSVTHKLAAKERDLGLSMWSPENAAKFTGDPINALTYSMLGPVTYGGNKLLNRMLPTGINTDLRNTITGHMNQRLSDQFRGELLDPNKPISLWDSNTTFHLGKKYGVDWQNFSDGFIARHNQNVLNQNDKIRGIEIRIKQREWAKENGLEYNPVTKNYVDSEGFTVFPPEFKADTPSIENTFDQSEIVQSGFGNLLTKPLTLFGKNELTPGTHLYRKIGNSAGLRDLINKGGAQAPGSLKMNSGFTIDTPFFGIGEAPDENYKGVFAVETAVPSKSKYNWSNQAGGTSNYGVAPYNEEGLMKNVPLEDLNVFRKKWFSNNYRRLDPENLDKDLKYADTQNFLENFWKWGVRGGLGYGAYQYGEAKDKEWKEGEKKLGGGVNIGDEVDETTMQRLINEGYAFEEI